MTVRRFTTGPSAGRLCDFVLDHQVKKSTYIYSSIFPILALQASNTFAELYNLSQ